MPPAYSNHGYDTSGEVPVHADTTVSDNSKTGSLPTDVYIPVDINVCDNATGSLATSITASQIVPGKYTCSDMVMNDRSQAYLMNKRTNGFFFEISSYNNFL